MEKNDVPTEKRIEYEWNNFLGGYIEVEVEVPIEPVGVWREGKETVSINGKLWHTPEAVLDKLDALEGQIKRMQDDTVMLHAIFNSGMSEDAKRALTYETGPYDVTVLSADARNFVKSLIASASKPVKKGD